MWKRKCEELIEKNNNLEEQILKMKVLPNVRTLETILTPGQIRLLLNPSKRKIHWNADDIASAISLRSVSSKAYRYLRNHNFPLPGLSTLRDWARCFNVDPGPLVDVMRMLKIKAKGMSEWDRLTVLSFDEIYISNKVSIDQANQQVVGPHRACQVIMARGLVGKWKQPVYYDYDRNMTKEIMFDIISRLYHSSLIVIAVTSDMGTGNIGFWNQVGIGFNKNVYFFHPEDDNLKIHVFADVPHLLKLARNHFLDHGFTINGVKVDRACLEKLLTASKSELTIAFKINRYHLDIKGTERQKVLPAVQLFSNQVAKAIKWCGEYSTLMDGLQWEKCAETIKLFNDWFDLFNADSMFGSISGKNAYGMNVEDQLSLINRMDTCMSLMRVGTHSNLIQFQK
jgi:hypothetical protein